MASYPWSAGDQLTAAALNAIGAANQLPSTAGQSLVAGNPVCVLPFSTSQVTLDTSATNSGTGTTITTTFVVGSNSNRALVLALVTGGSDATSITYAGAGLTKINSSSITGTTNFLDIWYLSAPATGSNSLVIHFSGSQAAYWNIYSYYNVAQSGQPEAHNTGIGGTRSATVTTTPLTNGGLVFGATYVGGATVSGSVYTNNKLTSTNTNLVSGDSGAI